MNQTPNRTKTPSRRRGLSLLALLALVAGSVFAANGPAGAADPVIVDIRVELNVMDDDESAYQPRVFEVTGVEAKAGQIELSEADEISNPDEWCGSVTVDIDPDAGTITIATEEACDFHTARVTITSEQIDAVELVSDDLWDDDFGGIHMLPVQITKSGNATELLWIVDFDETDDSAELKVDGAAVFSFTLVEADPEPTTTTTETETTTTEDDTASTTDVPGSTGPDGGATPIVTNPSYTG